MRAAVLNSARTLNAGPETPVVPDIQEIPGGVVVTETEPGGVDRLAENIIKYARTGKAIQDSGSGLAGDFPFAAVLAGAMTGAAVGSGIPAIGTAIGAVVGAVAAASSWIIAQFGGGPSFWEGAGEDVHWWFTNYAPEAYLAWLRAQNLNPYGGVQESARCLLLWNLQQNGRVVWPGHRTINAAHDDESFVLHAFQGPNGPWNYEGAYAAVARTYADLGVDFHATVAMYNAEGMGRLVYIKRSVLLNNGEVIDGVEDADGAIGDEQAARDGSGIAVALIAALAVPLLTKR